MTNFIRDYLEDQGGEAQGGHVLKAARAAGFSEATVKRARKRAGIMFRRVGFPSVTVWSLEDETTVGSQSDQSAQLPEPEPTDPTVTPLVGR